MEEEIETGQGSETGEVAPVAGPPEADGGGSGINPAWNELLEVVPSQLHSMVTPHLQKWDSNFQTKVNEVHSQYAPYKEFVENQITPEQIQYGLRVAQAIEADPMQVITALTDYAKANGYIQEPVAKETPEQQGQIDESEIPPELLEHPMFKQMQQQLQTVTQYLVQQDSKSKEEQENQALQTELASLKEEKGEFDEDWVLTKALQYMQQGQQKSLGDLVDEYRSFETSILQKARQPGPKVLPSGGSAPVNQFDPAKASDQERRGYIAKMLAAAAQQSQ